jgi:hypothetical protein
VEADKISAFLKAHLRARMQPQGLRVLCWKDQPAIFVDFCPILIIRTHDFTSARMFATLKS